MLTFLLFCSKIKPMLPILIDFDGHPLISWTVCALIGGWAGFFSLRSDLRQRGITEIQIIAFFLGGVITWFIGAHLGQVISVGGTFTPFGIRSLLTGFVLYGGVIALIPYGFLAWHITNWKDKLWVQELWDCGTLAILWALVFGRFGCTLYGCCYGTPSHGWPGYTLNEIRWDYTQRTFPHSLSGVRLHPTPLYEAFGIGLTLVLLYWMRRSESKAPGRYPPGAVAWIGWISYGIIRFLTEFIRMDPRGEYHFGLSFSQWIALVTILIGIYIVNHAKQRNLIPIYLSDQRR